MTTKRFDTDNMTYQDLLANPELLVQIERQARTERAAAVDRYFVAPVRSLLKGGEHGAAGVGAPAHG
jgi:hypothetical protein